MESIVEIRPIAHIYTDFATKFGVPRQSGIVPELRAKIVFEPEYRDAEALRGIEAFSYLWLIWHFSKAEYNEFSPTVRPPRLGGNTRMGVFATRSPFRPNSLGLSSVKLESVEKDGENGTVLIVSGADMIDGTPIFDIKPYVPYADCHENALGGFASQPAGPKLTVDISHELLSAVAEEKQKALLAVLAQDPRPSYQKDPQRVYGFEFAGLEVKFRVEDNKLTVLQIL